MASPATDMWWSTFLDAHGRDSEEESAFYGFLSTQKIAADASPDVLQDAYLQFHAWMAESEERGADAGPDRATLAAQQAVTALEQEFVPKSRMSAPGVEKPKAAATRPKATRAPLVETGPGPTGEAQMVSAEPPSVEEPAQAAHQRPARHSGRETV